MSITNIQKQCHNCYNYYQFNPQKTTDFDIQLYCSKQCSNEDEQRLAEGNSLVDAAQKENPLLFMTPITASTEDKSSKIEDSLSDLKRMLKIER